MAKKKIGRQDSGDSGFGALAGGSVRKGPKRDIPYEKRDLQKRTGRNTPSDEDGSSSQPKAACWVADLCMRWGMVQKRW